MRLIYFDEVKYHPPLQPRHWIGALSVPSEIVSEIEGRLSEIANDFFGTKQLSHSTEFHAVDMMHSAAHFKGRAIEDRLTAVERILAVAADDRIRHISVCVSPDRMIASASSAPEKAFVFFVERAQIDLGKVSDSGILIGDLDSEYADEGVTNLSKYREEGTPFFFGRSIDRLIDSVYFFRLIIVG